MNIEDFRDYCLALPGTTEETPFGPDVLVMKVMGKMYALCSIDHFESINLKCDPERAVALREEFPQVKPGYHMNKTHWNTIETDGLNDDFIKNLINHSYNLVSNSLPKKIREQLKTK